MSTYYITTQQAETSKKFEHLETMPHNCQCGQSYALKGDYHSHGSTSHDVFIVCDSCTENNPRQVYEMSNLEKALEWYASKGIDARIQDDAWITIDCNGYDIEIAESEVEWRAIMFDLGK